MRARRTSSIPPPTRQAPRTASGPLDEPVTGSVVMLATAVVAAGWLTVNGPGPGGVLSGGIVDTGTGTVLAVVDVVEAGAVEVVEAGTVDVVVGASVVLVVASVVVVVQIVVDVIGDVIEVGAAVVLGVARVVVGTHRGR